VNRDKEWTARFLPPSVLCPNNLLHH